MPHAVQTIISANSIISDSSEKVNTSDEEIQFSREALNERQISELQKRGIKGDALLNAIDLSEEILSVNGDITEEYKKKNCS